MLDTDFIVWKKVEGILEQQAIGVIHREELMRNVYPSQECLQMDASYTAFARWNWVVRPCNTALLYIGDEAFKSFYVNEAKSFMKAARGEDPLIYIAIVSDFTSTRFSNKVGESNRVDSEWTQCLKRSAHTSTTQTNTPPRHQCKCSAENDPPPK